MKQKDWFSFSNLYFIAPIVLVVSLSVGMVFYMIVNDWDFSVAYFFASTVLMGNMYLIPTESSSFSQTFTLWYFLWGSSLMAGAVTALANDLVSNAVRVAADERQRILQSSDEPYDADEDGIVGFGDRVQYYTSKLFYEMGWYDYKAKYITLLIFCMWLVVGVLYGLLFEEWPLMESIYFAFAAVSASGSSAPDCVGPSVYECTIGTARSFLMGTYIIVGVPLFAYTVGQFAGLIVEHAVKAKEQKLMVRPLTEAEFTFARQLRKGVLHHRDDDNSDFNSKNGNKGNSENGISTGRTDEALCRISEGSGDFSSRVLPPPLPPPPPPPVSKHASPAVTREAMTIDLGEFILLELLRLQKVDMTDLLCLKALFDEIDDSGDGVIDMEEMRRHNLTVLARGDTDRKGHQTTQQQQYTSKHALLTGADKFSYGALNQQDFACDTPNNTVVSGSGSNLSGLASESSLAECSSPSVTICAAEEGRYHDHQFNEHINANNTIEDETANGMGEEEERATNYSDMYNSMVIPVIQQLHEQSLWNMPPLNTDGDAFDDQERSPVPPALKFLSGRARRNTLWSSVELLTRSSSDKSNRESSSALLSNSVKQKKKATHFEVSAGRSRSSTTGSVASNDLTQQM